ncbi:hypothetical protein Gotri_012606 [Gossypium trilobum]|uniref:Uncharacterized protein n=1 Tax=Gossypium trilobum TaxID=34281 RepID=A0A7J9DQS5_9ROSI|nr:hypothetical protein [Gossypium trilobum]
MASEPKNHISMELIVPTISSPIDKAGTQEQRNIDQLIETMAPQKFNDLGIFQMLKRVEKIYIEKTYDCLTGLKSTGQQTSIDIELWALQNNEGSNSPWSIEKKFGLWCNTINGSSCVTPTGNTVIPVVQEFYASLKDQIIRGRYGEITSEVTVQGEEVQISSNLEKLQKIDMEDVMKYLTQGMGSWNYRQDTRLPTNFNQAIMFPVAKIWMQFIGTRIAPVLNVSNINVFQAILLYALNYPPDMFSPVPTYHNVEAALKEECAAQEYPEIEAEYEVAFWPQYSTKKGLLSKARQDKCIRVVGAPTNITTQARSRNRWSKGVLLL